MVLRVSPRITLDELKKQICSEKELDFSSHHLVHPGQPDTILDLNATLDVYGCAEITLMSNSGGTSDVYSLLRSLFKSTLLQLICLCVFILYNSKFVIWIIIEIHELFETTSDNPIDIVSILDKFHSKETFLICPKINTILKLRLTLAVNAIIFSLHYFTCYLFIFSIWIKFKCVCLLKFILICLLWKVRHINRICMYTWYTWCNLL